MRLAFLLSLFLIGCHHESSPASRPSTPAPEAGKPAPTAELKLCCEQCLAAAKRDPAGMDLRMSPCAKYPPEWNGGPGVDQTCHDTFEKRGITVGDCQAQTGPAQNVPPTP